MKRTAVGVLLVSLFAGSAAMAGQGYGRTLDHRDPPRASVTDHRDAGRDSPSFTRGDEYGRYEGRDGRHFDNNDRRDFHPGPRSGPPPRVAYRHAPRFEVYQPPRGYVVHSWREGERLPVAYYQPRYVIGDYRDCGLREPPRGYHWVRVNNDVVLAAVTTGVVLDVAFHLFS